MSSRWIVVVALCAAALWSVGCGGSTEATEHAHGATGTVATAGGELVPPGQAHVGDRTTCPVSHEEFVVTAESPHADYEGSTYYFCCPHCIERFQASPGQFTTPAAATPAEPPPVGGSPDATPPS